ncbi:MULTISPECIES: hypothetical protein [Paenibacillus]|uniref:hypothetical protein n=1 Tax=Paenibacillus TaxID=44249 RepID=UPI00096C0434|nr:hypothetical protein [Paenibacillus odorifer]OMD13662.1 hypothetical protein BJP50_23455 [Paenibacillus odorifer]OME49891.1 hypothetical protein BSK59_23515 [Paenibacillus odorifer]
MKKDRWAIFLIITVVFEFINITYSLIFEQSIEWFSLIILILFVSLIVNSNISKNKKMIKYNCQMALVS